MKIENSEPDKEYEDIKKCFQSEFKENGIQYGNDDFIEMAIKVFCVETLKQAASNEEKGLEKSIGEKAALSIVQRLMGFPKSDKEWLVDFPYVWMNKENSLSKSEIKRRGIGFKVWYLIESGLKVTHATARVAADNNISPQKAAKDYYDWKLHHDGIKEIAMRSSNFTSPKKE